MSKPVDVFETQLEQKKQGKIDEKVFMESRLRLGVYGQRYDNGQRHDGEETRTLEYPRNDWSKGPGNPWDHPGMQRIKIPYGRVTPEQLESLADLAEEFSDDILHVTTRQDIQLHYVHIESTPEIMRRLDAVGITTQEACGNVVRNVTGCPIAGVCRGEEFDISPYAAALSAFLLGHKDAQGFGRKFKIAFSGCETESCGLAMMHDIGLVAKVVDGRRGFAFYVGGGLGAVPHPAALFDDFVPEEEILPLTQAIARVFERLGEKKNRARARLKFLVAKIGIDEFRKIVLEERKVLPEDPRWTQLPSIEERPKHDPVSLGGAPTPDGFNEWYWTNAYAQRQTGYYTVTVALPLGDMTSDQARALAEVNRRYSGEPVRLTVEQNAVLRWISGAHLVDLWKELKQAELAEPGAGTTRDITACPGTDTCKLGIASSRGLAREIRNRNPKSDVKVKISGCFNSCGQHHAADIGFYGVTRKRHGYSVPFFQLVLGGEWTNNVGSFGLATVAIPSKYVPEALDRLTAEFELGRRDKETFREFILRVGRGTVKTWLEDLLDVPPPEAAPEVFSDWGDPRKYTITDMGVGECAGEVVSTIDFDLAAAEREVFEAQIALDERRDGEAAERALRSMLKAAWGLVRLQFQDAAEEPEVIVNEFKARFFETKLFFDKYAGGKFGRYLFRQFETPYDGDGREAHRRVEEAQLFLEAAHSLNQRLGAEVKA